MDLYIIDIDDCFQTSKRYRLHKHISDLEDLGQVLISINNRPNNMSEADKAFSTIVKILS
jgi:hypothetical protein